MIDVQENKEVVFECGGKELAKVLYYYGYIPDVNNAEYKIVCPFHNDINPSMIVNTDDGSYFCFGCGESGNALTFVNKVEKDLNDLFSLKKYFEILKSKKCVSLDFSNRTKRLKKKSKQLYTEAYDYYHGLSKIDWKNDTLEEVVLTRSYMRKRGFLSGTLNKCKAKITYNRSYQLIFPMIDNGKFKGWVCRTMIPEIEKKRKYLYNEGFSKATTLVGNYGSKDWVIVVEGYMDRLKFIQFGEENVVAILGWKMTQEQIRKLKDAGINHVISALDNDECGKKGTEFLKTQFSVTRFCFLKGVKDPGEMTKDLFEKMYKKTKIKLAQDRRKR